MDSTLIAIGAACILGISLSAILRQSQRRVNKKQKKKSKGNSSILSYPRKFCGALQEFTSQTKQATSVQNLQGPSAYTLSLVIPAYNEARRLTRMLDDALPVLQAKVSADKSFSAEIILVDDGSKDDTCAVYARYVKTKLSHCPRISFKLLKLPQNGGKGKAVSEGFLASAGELILFADADGSTDFTAALKFHSIMQQQGDEPTLICGSRATAQSAEEKNQVKRSLFRWILMKAFHAFISIFGVRSVQDTQCGFKMMNRRAARLVAPWIHITGWIFDVEMILIAEGKGVRVLEVPVPWKEMDGTKLSLAIDSLKMAKDLLRIRFNYITGLWKYQ